MIGEKVLHYKIVEKLGEGGMGVVYLAEDTKLDRQVAIKFLPRQISSNSDERKRFEIEAKAAAALNHPNISTIHAIEESGDELFIVMEYINGQELKEKVKSEKLKVEFVINIAFQIVEGLKVAHEKGIVHRDIKPSNIMITEKGQVKIMDFGLAKIGSGAHLTKEQSTIGTTAYMSPEQIKGEIVDHRSDIWSFGVVLYEMITSKLPFRGDYDQAIIYSILNDEPNWDEFSVRKIPADFQKVISKCLQKNPENRYHDVADLLSDLAKISNTSNSGSTVQTGQELINKKVKKINPAYYGATVLLILIIATYFFYFSDRIQESAESTGERKMIVVLPLENMGPAEDEYFADGLTEEITSRLASFPELGVIARTSAIQFKNTGKTIHQIGEELNVEYVIEGTVRWDRSLEGPSRVRVTPQLIRVSDATQLWSDRYDEIINDIFTVQSDIAVKVIEQLDVTLLESGRRAIQAKPTENFDAYMSYLKGMKYTEFYEIKNIQQAMQAFRQAIALDPEFAKAYSHLSQAHSKLVHFGYDKSEDRRIAAKKNAEIALKLAPDDHDAHIAMAYFHYWVNRDYKSAEQEFAIAEKYQPNNAEILSGRAFVQRRQGHWKESIENLERAIQLSPLHPTWYSDQGYTYTILREYQRAIPYYDKAIKLRDNFSFAYSSKCETIQLWKGDLEESRSVLSGLTPADDRSYFLWILQSVYEKDYKSAMDLILNMSEDMLYSTSYVRPILLLRGWIYQLNHQYDLADKDFRSMKNLLKEKIQNDPDDFRLYTALGLTLAFLGDNEKAIELGKKAVDMYPVSGDALEGSDVVIDLTWIYTIVGEHEKALEKLDYLLSIPSLMSVPYIQIDPKWDSLKSHPKYDLLLEKYSGK